MKIPDTQVNDLIKEAVAGHIRPHKGNKILEVYSASQSGINPPSFRFLVNDTRLIHFSYERYLMNQMREAFGFEGVPIRLIFRKKGKEK